MILNLKKPIKTPDGLLIREISGNSDGSYAITFDGANLLPCVRFYNASGEPEYPMAPEDRACRLAKVFHETFGRRVEDFYGGYYTENIFPNGWTDVRAAGRNMLLDDDFKPIVANYERVWVFNCGIAIKGVEPKGSKKGMLFLDLKGRSLRVVDNVVNFVGDGCYLAEDGGTDQWSLHDFAGNQLAKKPIIGCEMTTNGSFVLTTVDGLKRLYAPDGTAVTIEVATDSVIMPDGYFIHYNDCHLIDGIYSPAGILDMKRSSIYSFKKTSNYYLLTGENVTGALYDCQGEYQGKNFKFANEQEGFAFFERGDILYIFNRFGKILSGKYVED